MGYPRGNQTSIILRFVRVTVAAWLIAAPSVAAAQEKQPEPQTRAGQIEQQQAEKVVRPYQAGKAERWLDYAESTLTTGSGPHPFFENAYSGGGFTLGAGYLKYISPFNTIDVRGSVTFSGYKRVEAEFIAPELFGQPMSLSLLGGWRDATEVGFYGIGTNTSQENRVNYSFEQPYASASLRVRPGRRHWVVAGGVEVSQWNSGPSDHEEHPSIEMVYTPDTLPGLGAQPTYVHTQGTVGIDSRLAEDYARRGGFYGVTFHDYTDPDSQFGFNRIEYEAIQHIPVLRETWVLSLRGRIETTSLKDGQQIPYFMLPALGSGSTLRAFPSWRFRDRNGLLLQAEWRVMVNRMLDLALFYDTGKVTADASDLSLDGLRNDVGVGVRFHGPRTTPLRIEVAYGNEGVNIVFGSSSSF